MVQQVMLSSRHPPANGLAGRWLALLVAAAAALGTTKAVQLPSAVAGARQPPMPLGPLDIHVQPQVLQSPSGSTSLTFTINVSLPQDILRQVATGALPQQPPQEARPVLGPTVGPAVPGSPFAAAPPAQQPPGLPPLLPPQQPPPAPGALSPPGTGMGPPGALPPPLSEQLPPLPAAAATPPPTNRGTTSLAAEAASIGGMSVQDMQALLAGATQAAGPGGRPYITTVTDASMVDLAQNMLRSLEAAAAPDPRLVVAMGHSLCSRFVGFTRTTCVQIYPDSRSEEQAKWGTDEYFQVVLRKHLILTVLLVSGLSTNLIFSDPDIVFLRSPVPELQRALTDADIVFTPNNYLEPQATTVEEVADTYEKRGLAKILIGPKRRHVDVNTGLFLARSNTPAQKLFMETLRIFKAQQGVHGHFQQYSLVQALLALPDTKLVVGGGELFTNGNVWWGHRRLLDLGKVVSVHANWMDSGLKRDCLKATGMWFTSSAGPWKEVGDTSTMDNQSKMVLSCTPNPNMPVGAAPAVAGGALSPASPVPGAVPGAAPSEKAAWQVVGQLTPLGPSEDAPAGLPSMTPQAPPLWPASTGTGAGALPPQAPFPPPGMAAQAPPPLPGAGAATPFPPAAGAAALAPPAWAAAGAAPAAAAATPPPMVQQPWPAGAAAGAPPAAAAATLPPPVQAAQLPWPQGFGAAAATVPPPAGQPAAWPGAAAAAPGPGGAGLQPQASAAPSSQAFATPMPAGGMATPLPADDGVVIDPYQVARIGGLSESDATTLLQGIGMAAGPQHMPFIMTVTDNGMLDLTHNMLFSLDSVPSQVPRLLVIIGAPRACEGFRSAFTVCVEIMANAGSEHEVAWGTPEYYRIVLQKHTILTILATSRLTTASIFTDPDIVYMDSPLAALTKLSEGFDMVFSPNNYLAKDALNVNDVALEYRRRGIKGLLVGHTDKRYDVNTGLFYMRGNGRVARLMYRAMEIFANEGGRQGHYQQYSLLQALNDVPDCKISVAPGDIFVNGNVFWGHRSLLDRSKIVAVHANWMDASMKRPCLETAGLIYSQASATPWSDPGDTAELEPNGKKVVQCHAPAARAAGVGTPMPAAAGAPGMVPGVAAASALDARTEAAATLGGWPPQATQRLLAAARQAAGSVRSAVILTIVDNNDTELCGNMLRSLAAVRSPTPRLIVATQDGLCERYAEFAGTLSACVEVPRPNGREAAAYGTPEYLEDVVHKLVILTVTATSGAVGGILYTDPDMVFLNPPLDFLGAYGKDVVFSRNNYLDRNPRNVDNVAMAYDETTGCWLPDLFVASSRSHVDLSVGLFYLQLVNSTVVDDLLLMALTILREQDGKPPHYMRYAFTRALQEMPEVNMAVEPGRSLVNGNEFWGHRDLLDLSKVVAVHANYMDSALKRQCLEAAGLWVASQRPEQDFLRASSAGAGRLDEAGKTVLECSKA